MQEGIQLPKLLVKIKTLKEAGLRAEQVAFSFMKRRVQPLMARDTLGYEYTGEGDSSRMPGSEIDDATSSIGWVGSLRTCWRTRPVRFPSTPSLIRQTRSVAVLSVRVLVM
jgi:hypothetical protein